MSDSNVPHENTTFATNELVTVCFTVPGTTDGHKGFKAGFSDSSPAIPSLVIGTVVSATSISSPNYPGNYQADVDQCWVKTPATGREVSLDFTSFDVSNFNLYYISVNV